MWMNIGVEKLDMHKGITIKVLLDSGATGMFIDKQMAARHGFKLQKLERPIAVRNVDGTNNSGGAITHQVKVNVYYKGHVERIRIDICDLGKTDNFGDAIVGSAQPKDKLGDRRGQNDKVSTPVWQNKNERGREEEKEKKGSNSRRREKSSGGQQTIKRIGVMNIEWDYSYYQPWSDNE